MRAALKSRNKRDYSKFLREGGEEMKGKSKGDVWKFLQDAATNPVLKKKMDYVIERKGKGWKPERLLKEFHALGYYDVSLGECNTILTGLRQPDWVY